MAFSLVGMNLVDKIIGEGGHPIGEWEDRNINQVLDSIGGLTGTTYKNIKKFIRIEPIINSFCIFNCSAALTIVLTMLADGDFERSDITSAGYAGLFALVSIAGSWTMYNVYKGVCEDIKTKGFTHQIMKSKVKRGYAKIYAEENDRLPEYQHALEQIQSK